MEVVVAEEIARRLAKIIPKQRLPSSRLLIADGMYLRGVLTIIYSSTAGEIDEVSILYEQPIRIMLSADGNKLLDHYVPDIQDLSAHVEWLDAYENAVRISDFYWKESCLFAISSSGSRIRKLAAKWREY